MKKVIESLDNPKIKEIRNLYKKKNRRALGKYCIEGKRIIEEALIHQAEIEKIIISSSYILDTGSFHSSVEQRLKQIEILTVSEKVFRSVAKTESPQGIIAVIRKESVSLENELNNLPQNPFILTLENIQDPGNMGTIIRTAEAAGVNLMLITKESTDPYSDKALRSSMGAVFLIPIVEVEGLSWVYELKKRKILQIATDLSADKKYDEVNYHGPINIIIGNEGHGISNELLNYADQKMKIPIYGRIESLNASIATGILVYKAQEKRRATNE